MLANDSDIDGDQLTVSLLDGPAHGALELRTDGSFRYEPVPEFSGTDSFTYQIDDGQGGTDIGPVVVEVTPLEGPAIGIRDGNLVVLGTGEADDIEVRGQNARRVQVRVNGQTLQDRAGNPL